jgi:Ca2+/H+ antiporter, TMEM165/GDT1 family
MNFDFPGVIEHISTIAASFLLIFLAEFGDKSQIVCMTLAAKHRSWPIFWGATAAFSMLNLLGVLFGAAVASWFPDFWLAILVAGLFGFFGVHSLMNKDDDEEGEETRLLSAKSLFVTALLLILVAEFGDKTQLAVAGLSTTYHVVAVWLGSTLALMATSAMGIVIGQSFLSKMPIMLIHRLSGALFLVFAAMALFKAYVEYSY